MAIVISRSGIAQHSSMCIHLFTSLVESGILEIERGQISGHFFKPFVAFSPTFFQDETVLGRSETEKRVRENRQPFLSRRPSSK